MSQTARADLFDRDSASGDLVNGMLALAREAVRTAIAHGGDQAAAILRRDIDALSPPLVAPSPRGCGWASEAPEKGADAKWASEAPEKSDLHLRAASGATVLREVARRQRTPASKDQFNAIAGVLAHVAALTREDTP